MGTALVYVGLQLPALYQTLSLLVMAYVLRLSLLRWAVSEPHLKISTRV